MNTLIDALGGNALTDNGALTNPTSGNANVDLFFTIGSARNSDISSLFDEAMKENVDLAARNLLWARDVRRGAGERNTFRKLLSILINSDDPSKHELASRILSKVPELGRWDDLFVAFGTPLEGQAIFLITNGLEDEKTQGLVAKWLPRNKHVVAKALRNWLKLSPKEYRKLIVGLSDTVEQKMSSKDWNEIEYSHVPSVAFSRYRSAFLRNDEDRFTAFIESVNKGEATVNADAVFPHDILRNIIDVDGCIKAIIDEAAIEAQWKSLPNYLEDNDERIIPVVDTSGSMSFLKNKISGSLYPLHVSLSLGLYLAERIEGPFANHFIAFSDYPSLHKLRGNNIVEKIKNLKRDAMGYGTDFVKVFENILEKAREFNVPSSEMPTMVLVLSDMEFNNSGSKTNFEVIKALYESHDYKMPKIVFWNLNARTGNNPVTIHDKDVALVSGFSPSILKSLLGGNLNPEQVMMDTLNVERYNY